MRTGPDPIFVDTLYLIARTYPHDRWHRSAAEADRSLPSRTRLVTTTEVLTEFLSGLAEKGEYYRGRAVAVVDGLLADPGTTVLPPSKELFLRALDLYLARPDQGFSLVDCVSMTVMKDHGITHALTHDHHFEQEGFVALIRR